MGEGRGAVFASMFGFVDKIAFDPDLDQLMACRVRGALCGNEVVRANRGP